MLASRFSVIHFLHLCMHFECARYMVWYATEKWALKIRHLWIVLWLDNSPLQMHWTKWFTYLAQPSVEGEDDLDMHWLNSWCTSMWTCTVVSDLERELGFDSCHCCQTNSFLNQVLPIPTPSLPCSILPTPSLHHLLSLFYPHHPFLPFHYLNFYGGSRSTGTSRKTLAFLPAYYRAYWQNTFTSGSASGRGTLPLPGPGRIGMRSCDVS